jgi:8-oxo-dGTP pyrophosphatase MutT (NUDIX family)
MQNSKFKNKPNEATTTADGRKIWLSRSVAVVSQVVIRNTKTNEFYTAIVKRGPASLGSIGLWCYPCGYLDWDETAREAAIRETFEEAGLDIEGLITASEPAMFVYKFPHLNSTPWHVDSLPDHHRQNVSLSHCFYFETESDILPIISSVNCEVGEVDQVKWVTLKEVIGSTDYPMAFDHHILTVELTDRINGLIEK